MTASSPSFKYATRRVRSITAEASADELAKPTIWFAQERPRAGRAGTEEDKWEKEHLMGRCLPAEKQSQPGCAREK
eukprot:1212661-Pleurochrysis_carterae.AAC.2